MNCPHCAMSLPDSTTYCPNCGSATTRTGTATAEESPYTYMEYSAYQPSAPPAPPPAPLYGQPPAYTSAGQPPRPPLSVPPRAPNPRRRRALILGLVAVVVLLILAGSGLLTYNFAVVQPNMRANATATAQAAVTATAYANSPQGAFTAATSGTPAVIDSLNGQNLNEFSPTSDGHCDYLNGAFHAREPTSHSFYFCLGNGEYSNFALQVQMQIHQGDRGGIIFRANPNTGELYLVDMDINGQFNFYIYKGFQGADSMTLYGGVVPDYNVGLNQTNLVTIVARGEDVFLYVNKVFAGEISDNTYLSGAIGLVASNDTQSTDVAYTNLKIWNLS